MKTLEISQATGRLSDYTQGVEGEPLILTENGEPVAALVSIQNADWETIKLSTDPKFLEIIEKSRARRKKEGGISPEEMRRRLNID